MAAMLCGPIRTSRRIRSTLASFSTFFALTLGTEVSRAGGVQTLDPVDVTDSTDDLVGTADSSTEGTITPKQLAERPLLRTGELLEGVPGLLISQHSGEGKANQYYLRGINLDHGTDFATSVDGMPVNMPTHAHGQGYSDLNFIIPELLGGIQYRKGPYYADEGDFSAVGAAHLDYVHELAHPRSIWTLGTDGYARAFVGGSVDLLKGKLLVGFEGVHDDGPWVNPDGFTKLNALLRYTRNFERDTLTIDAMGYQGRWNATNQEALRAIDEGLIGRYGTLDPFDKGSTYRYSLSGEWRHTEARSLAVASVYGIAYGLDLYNDFTYFLDAPTLGDQFHQKDRRIIVGGKISQTWFGQLLGRDADATIGLSTRNDLITPVALYPADRATSVTPTEDDVTQLSLALHAQARVQWLPKLRTLAGLRWDAFYWNVDANVPANAGSLGAQMVSPKLAIVLGPWAKTEIFVNAGLGFHSNDIRAATEKIQPQYGLAQTTVPPLERAAGAEIGARTALVPHLQTELTFWYLHLDSEQIFSGDAGVTSPSYASHRYGIESANYYTPFPWLTLDVDVAYSVAHFIGDPAGSQIPGSPTWVVSAGAAAEAPFGLFGSLRMHYFGARPLIDDGSVLSKPSTIVNARVGYRSHLRRLENWRLWVDVFNALGSNTSDIDYYYLSRLPGEPPSGVNDIHTHPATSTEVRVSLEAVY
jgi:hypothetical protein